MKRTKKINTSRFLKRSNLRRAPLVLFAGAFIYSTFFNEEEVTYVENVDDCMADTSLSQQDCEMAYKNALAESEKTAPKFDTQARCEQDFREDGCYESDNGTFIPVMSGFMIGSALNRYDRNRYYHPAYSYLSSYGTQKVMSDGTPLNRAGGSRYTVPRGTTETSKPRSTSTISRGGFGQIASRNASYSSSRSSWGG